MSIQKRIRDGRTTKEDGRQGDAKYVNENLQDDIIINTKDLLNMAAYDPELDVILWKGEPILFKDGRATLTAQIASYNGGPPKFYVREEGSFQGWQQDQDGRNLTTEPKQLRSYGRPYLRRMEYNIIQSILPDLTVGVETLARLTEEYTAEKGQ